MTDQIDAGHIAALEAEVAELREEKSTLEEIVNELNAGLVSKGRQLAAAEKVIEEARFSIQVHRVGCVCSLCLALLAYDRLRRGEK